MALVAALLRAVSLAPRFQLTLTFARAGNPRFEADLDRVLLALGEGGEGEDIRNLFKEKL